MRICGEIIRLFLKYCIYCASAPSLHSKQWCSQVNTKVIRKNSSGPVLLSVIPHVLHSDPVLHACTYTLKRKVSFRSTSYLLSEFQVSECIHAGTENSVNELIKNSKHITAITCPPKPDLTNFHPKQLVKNAKITLQTPNYLLVM